MQFTALTWNLFHGRDFPPDPRLLTWRSRLLRISERNATHIQVNRELRDEFASLLARAEWDVALLQECPPRFCAELARACGAVAHRVLTSRNSLGALRGLAARLNPDLIASGEGGSNLTLVRRRGSLGGIVERRGLTIHEGWPERRAMSFVRTEAGICVANLHATNDVPRLAAADVAKAAAAAVEWAGGSPLLFGGDLNLRPATSRRHFTQLAERFGLSGSTGPGAIDHLLARGLQPLERPRRWPPERRELRLEGLALRLSDHTPVQARFAAPNVEAAE
jgi:hypothetical protein